MFNEQEIEFIQSLGLMLDFDNLTDDNIVNIENAVSVALQQIGFDAAYGTTVIGEMCEIILDKLK